MSAAGARAALAMKQKQKKLQALQSSRQTADLLDQEQREKLIQLLSENDSTCFISNLAEGKQSDASREVEDDFDEAWDGTVAWDDYEGVMPVVRPHFLSEAHYNFIVRQSSGKAFDTTWFDKYVKYPPHPDDPLSRKLALSVVEALAEAEVDESDEADVLSKLGLKSDLDSPPPPRSGAKRSMSVTVTDLSGANPGKGARVRSRSVIIKDGMESQGHIEDAPPWVFAFNEFVWLNQVIVSDVYFNGLVVTCIVVAGILVGVQSYPAMDGNAVLAAMDFTIQIIFTFECLFKIFAEGVTPWVYWTGPERSWNNFDFWLVFIVWLPFDGGNVAFLRLLRLMRLLKLVGKVKQLQVIVMGLAKGLSSVSYIMVLMLLIFYLFAVAGVDTFRENDPFHFGSLGVAMLTLFRCATLEDWSDIMYINFFGCDSQYSGVVGVYGGLDMEVAPYEELGTRQKGMGTLAGFFPVRECWNPTRQPLVASAFFILFILIAAFVLLSLFVGAVCGGMSEALDAFKEELAQELLARNLQGEDDGAGGAGVGGSSGGGKYTVELLRGAFDACDEDGSGEIDAEELSEAMTSMGEIGVTVEVAQTIIEKMDGDQNGTLGFDEFFKLMTGTDLTAQQISDDDNRRKSPSKEMEQENPAEAAEERAKREAARKEGQDTLQLVSKIRRAWRAERQVVSFNHIKSPRWRSYLEFSVKAKHFVNDPRFVNMVTATIIAAGVVVGIQTELSVPCHAQPSQPAEGKCVEEEQPVLDALDNLILAIFTVEVVGKLVAEGLSPLRYFDDSWNCFDFFIVAACFVFMLPFMPDAGGMLAMLRLLRLLRVLKLVKALPELRIIIEALISGFGSISFVTIILFMFFYLFANVGMIFFGKNDPMHFGNLQLALVSLFRAATLDDWTDMMYINMFGCDVWGYDFGKKKLGFSASSLEGDHANCKHPVALGWIAAAYMVSFIIIGAMVLLTLFIGIVATAMEEAKADQREESKQDQKAVERAASLGIEPDGVQLELYREIFHELNVKKDGKLDKESMRPLEKALPLVQAAKGAFALMQQSAGDQKLDKGAEVARLLEEMEKEHAGKNRGRGGGLTKSKSFLEEAAEEVIASGDCLTRSDLDRVMSLVDENNNGAVKLSEFLVLMDFMRRVDENPAIIREFRSSYNTVTVEKVKRKRRLEQSSSSKHAAAAPPSASGSGEVSFSPVTPVAPSDSAADKRPSGRQLFDDEEEVDDQEAKMTARIVVLAPTSHPVLNRGGHGGGGGGSSGGSAAAASAGAESETEVVELERECAALREAMHRHTTALILHHQQQQQQDPNPREGEAVLQRSAHALRLRNEVAALSAVAQKLEQAAVDAQSARANPAAGPATTAAAAIQPKGSSSSSGGNGNKPHVVSGGGGGTARVAGQRSGESPDTTGLSARSSFSSFRSDTSSASHETSAPAPSVGGFFGGKSRNQQLKVHPCTTAESPDGDAVEDITDEM